MKKLQKEFEAFDKAIRLDKETATLIEKREKLKKDIEDYFPEECATYGIAIKKCDLRFIHQGSYEIGTAISNPDKCIDLDYALIMPLDFYEHTDPRKVKKAVRGLQLV